jgi:hypothetical protein
MAPPLEVTRKSRPFRTLDPHCGPLFGALDRSPLMAAYPRACRHPDFSPLFLKPCPRAENPSGVIAFGDSGVYVAGQSPKEEIPV